jgi:hypothetical protein
MAPTNDRNNSSTRKILFFAVVDYCRCCNRTFSGNNNNLLWMYLMTVMMAAKEVGGDDCGENVGDVCMCFVDRDADDGIHCKAGRKGNRKYHDRLIS